MIRVIDFESTGLPPDADVVEAAFVDIELWSLGDGRLPSILSPWSSVVAATRPVTVEARAAHHLSDAEIASGISWGKAKLILTFSGTYCAHNADFEKAFFNPEDSRWIDTYKCALRLWPESPKHTNSVLRYFLEGCDPGELGMPPHRALPDCHVTARILIKCLGLASIEQLVAWSEEPPLLPRVPMGKHFGKPWSEVPTDYLEWATRQDFDGGVAHTVRVELAKRKVKR
jgi:exodeoxyribonuclease X